MKKNYSLFHFDETVVEETVQNGATCRTCKHRIRFELNDHSTKVVQCCELQPSKRSNSGYKTIKVTDKACRGYENK